jgi:hypothetical protein
MEKAMLWMLFIFQMLILAGFFHLSRMEKNILPTWEMALNT